MQAYCDSHGLSCRPHVKTHKLPRLAHIQVDAGAVGITCQKLGEAEVMVDAGLYDVMIAFPLVGTQKIQRLADLAKRANLTVVGDSSEVIQGLSRVLSRAGSSVDFLVECDTGLHRAGVQRPDEAAHLAGIVAASDGLRF